jgi:predicted RNA-binding protein with PUA-like domain
MRAAVVGETCVIYHTGDERRAVGLATVERAAYPDPKKNDDKTIVIDVRAGARLPKPVSLDQIKADGRFADSPLVKMGRLSVVALTPDQYSAILELAEM